MKIPFCLWDLEKASKKSKRFIHTGESLSKMFPHLEMYLQQAEISLSSREYLSVSFLSSLIMFLFVSVVMVLLTIKVVPLDKCISISLTVGASFFIITLFYQANYPRLLVNKKVRNLERNLLYSLKHLYIQIKAGVPLFDGMLSVSKSNYGPISEEFKKIIKKVNTGTDIEKAIEEASKNNPSIYFRRALWQINNGIKAGSDVGNVIKAIILDIGREQRTAIREYGSKLNPMTLVYMMVAVIIPSLGITLLIVLSSFSGASVGELTFWIILAGITIFQFMFLGIIKSKRPNII